MNDKVERISRPLVAWYRAFGRDLPWRRTRDPYAIWVSEIMLQQTQVATALPYYELWMQRFPTLSSLAEADDDEVLHAWQGLGYYSRARNLLKGAREVISRYQGRVPRRLEELMALPGVGRYTAGAIASTSFDLPAPVVDGNVTRVLCRLFALRGDPKRSPVSGRLWEIAEQLIPPEAPATFTQAIMELGAVICTPRKPRCSDCPVSADCEARRLNLAEELPETASRPKATEVSMAAILPWCSGRVLLVQRREDESRWAGMWQFPNVELAQGESGPAGARRAAWETLGIDVLPGRRAALVRHSVTRYRITLEAFHGSVADARATAVGCKAWNWVAPNQLGDYALPAAHRKIAAGLVARDEQLELGFNH